MEAAETVSIPVLPVESPEFASNPDPFLEQARVQHFGGAVLFVVGEPHCTYSHAVVPLGNPLADAGILQQAMCHSSKIALYLLKKNPNWVRHISSSAVLYNLDVAEYIMNSRIDAICQNAVHCGIYVGIVPSRTQKEIHLRLLDEFAVSQSQWTSSLRYFIKGSLHSYGKGGKKHALFPRADHVRISRSGDGDPTEGIYVSNLRDRHCGFPRLRYASVLCAICKQKLVPTQKKFCRTYSAYMDRGGNPSAHAKKCYVWTCMRRCGPPRKGSARWQQLL